MECQCVRLTYIHIYRSKNRNRDQRRLQRRTATAAQPRNKAEKDSLNTMGAGASAEQDPDAVWKLVDEIRASNPGNRCTKYLSKEYYDSLSQESKEVFAKCVRTGIDNKDSGLGCYAMKPADYETLLHSLIRSFKTTTMVRRSHATSQTGTSQAWGRLVSLMSPSLDYQSSQ